MPRETRQRVRQNNTQLRESNPVPLQVVATPRSTLVVPETKINRVASALSAVSPGLQKHLQVEHNRFVAEETAKAQAEASRLGEQFNDKELDKVFNDSQSPFYQEAFVSMRGKLKALSDSRSLVEQYETQFDKEEGDLEKFLSEFSTQATDGITDGTFLDSYTATLEQQKQGIRNGQLKTEVSNRRDDVNTGIFSLISESANRLGETGETMSVEELNLFYRDAKEAFNVSFRDVDPLALEAISEAAIANGRPELLDVFDENKPDGTPGLANNPKYSQQINVAKAQATRAAEAKQAKVDALSKFTFRKNMQDRLAAGKFVSDRELEQGVASKLLTPGEALSFRQNQIDHYQDLFERQEIKNAIARNDIGFLASNSGDKRITEEFDSWAVETLNESRGLDGIQQVVTRGAELGQKHKPWEFQLNNVNPVNADAFKQSASLYKNIEASNPQYAERLINERQSALYDIYWNAQTLGGQTEDQALQIATKLASTEITGGGSAALQTRDAISSINSTTSKLLENGFRQDAVNSTFVRDRVKQLAEMNLAFGNSDVGSALDWAEKRFRSTHTVVNGRWAETGNNPVPADLTEASEWFTDVFAEEVKDRGGDVDEEGYYIQPDPRTVIDGTWGIYGETNDFPVGDRITPNGLVDDFHKNTLANREDIEAERIRLRDRKKNEEEAFTLPGQSSPTFLNSL